MENMAVYIESPSQQNTKLQDYYLTHKQTHTHHIVLKMIQFGEIQNKSMRKHFYLININNTPFISRLVALTQNNPSCYSSMHLTVDSFV